ncbi:MAG: helix-turn-helix domain-containing protein, partial [Rhodobacteraceae bacterium]|nr:helix-turn-helix domain-containing protein [Paracoccaceae bacterium]
MNAPSMIRPDEFARAAGISLRTAQAAMSGAKQGKKWHGHSLPVVELAGTRGGKSGNSLALLTDLLPSPLREKLGLDQDEAPVERPVQAPVECWRIEKAVKRQRILAPVLRTAPKSRERREAVERASIDHEVSKPTLYRWLREYEAKGVAALLPNRPVTAGKPRVKITRAWDNDCGLPEEVQDAIAAKLAATARGLIP